MRRLRKKGLKCMIWSAEERTDAWNFLALTEEEEYRLAEEREDDY